LDSRLVQTYAADWRKVFWSRARIVSRKSRVSPTSFPLLVFPLWLRDRLHSEIFSCGSLALLVLSPCRLGLFNIAVLPLLTTTPEQNHKPFAILAEIDAIATSVITLKPATCDQCKTGHLRRFRLDCFTPRRSMSARGTRSVGVSKLRSTLIGMLWWYSLCRGRAL